MEQVLYGLEYNIKCGNETLEQKLKMGLLNDLIFLIGVYASFC